MARHIDAKFESLDIGISNHEFGLYENGVLIKVFRTDSDVSEIVSAVRHEADRYRAQLSTQTPSNSYEVRSIECEKKRVCPGVVHN